MSTKHEDLSAYKMTVTGENSDTYSAFTGSTSARIHHITIFNTSTTDAIDVHIIVNEGTISEDVTLRKVTLQPEEHTIWAGGLGSDDTLKVKGTNNTSNSVTLDLSWW